MKRKDFKRALELVKPALTNNIAVEQGDSFTFINDQVITYNEEMRIAHPLKGIGITGAAKSLELYELIKSLKAEDIEIERRKNEFIIKAGRAEAGFSFFSGIKLPMQELNSNLKFFDIDEKIIEAIKFVIPFATPSLGYQYNTFCVHVSKNGYIESFDNKRIARHRIDNPKIDTFLIPSNSAKEIVKYNISKMAREDFWVHFKTKEGTEISCRVYEDSFEKLELDKHLKVGEGDVFQFPHKIYDVIESAHVFAKRETITDEEITITIGKKRCTVESSSEVGWFRDEMNIDYDRSEIVFMIPPTFLSDILKVGDRKCLLSKKKIKFQSENWEYVSGLVTK